MVVGGAVHLAHLSSGYRHVLGKSCCMLMLGCWLLPDGSRVFTTLSSLPIRTVSFARGTGWTRGGWAGKLFDLWAKVGSKI